MSHHTNNHEQPSFEDRETKREDHLLQQARMQALAKVGIKLSGGRHVSESGDLHADEWQGKKPIPKRSAHRADVEL